MTGPVRLDEASSEEAARLAGAGAIAILPVGATEIHGPHLPLSTDTIIAEEAARRAAAKIARAGRAAAIAPAIAFAVTEFGREFPGTVCLDAATARGLLRASLDSLRAAGFRTCVLSNGHLEPGHLDVLEEAAAASSGAGFRVLFPNYSRKPLALRLSDEFRRGACHAGRYETSLLLAVRPDLVRMDLARALPPNEISLVPAIRAGVRSFREAGGPRAYFGDPAAATPEEGEALFETLSDFLVEACAAD